MCHAYDEKGEKKKKQKKLNCPTRNASEYLEEKNRNTWKYLKQTEMKEKVRKEYLCKEKPSRNQILPLKSHQINKYRGSPP